MAFIYVDSDGSLAVKDCYEQRKIISDIGGSWDAIDKVWRVTFTTYNLNFLLDNLGNPAVSADMETLVQKQIEKEQYLARIKTMSKQNVPVRLKVPGMKMSLHNYQRLGVMFALANGFGALVADEMGLGKEISVDTPVLTDRGWIRVGDIRIGDRVYSRDGRLSNVTGVYPQGRKEILRMAFSDDTYVDCGWEHLWAVMSNNDAVRRRGWRVLNTRSLFGDLLFGKKKPVHKWRIPLVEPIEYPSANLMIPPYLLGVLLGDGCLTNDGLTFVPGDEEVPSVVSSFLPKKYRVNKNADYGTSTRFSVVYDGNGNPMSREITAMGLRLTGEKKFIPGKYKTASVRQRKELLAGLLDTDGAAMGSRTRFSTSSEQLADDVIDLVRSLGGMAVKGLVPGRTRMRNNKVCHEIDSWQLTIRTGFNPFRAPSCVAKWKKSSKLVKTIVSIEPHGFADTVCISVDSCDSTYVIKDYIVTHNTVQAIAAAMCLKMQGRARCVLIVTPASLKYNWPIEIEKFTDEKYVVIDGTADERIVQWLRDDVFFYVVNYELILEDLFGGREFKEKKNESFEAKHRREVLMAKAKQRARILAPVRTRMWDLVAVDEAHAMKSHSARRTRNVKQLRAKFRIALTGTPMDGRLEELHSVMGFVAPGLLGSKTRFFQRHVETDFWGRVTGYKRLGEVSKRIEPYFIRRLKRDVLKDLPDKIYENKVITLSAAEAKIYEQLAEGGHEATEDEEAVVACIRCKQFCNWPPMIDDGCKETSKMDAFREVLDEIVGQNGHKALVFSQYKEMLNILVGEIEKMGFIYLRIDGDTPKKSRADMQKQFDEDPKIDLMVGTEAMSLGLNFTAANYVINYDDNWSPSVMGQREDRCHRLGQKNVVTVVNFICKNTIEERIRGVIYGKSKITAEVLGDQTDETILRRLNPREIAKLL